MRNMTVSEVLVAFVPRWHAIRVMHSRKQIHMLKYYMKAPQTVTIYQMMSGSVSFLAYLH